MKFQTIILICLISLKFVKNQSCPNLIAWQNYKAKFNIQFYNSSLELIGCNNYFLTLNHVMSDTKTLAINKFAHWSYNDGILHKGFHYKDGSYQYLGRKRRSLSANSSNYYGLPYQIYSATSGYQFKKYISYTTNFETDGITYDGLNWFSDDISLNKDQGICGNCWAFTAIGSIEGAIRKTYNKTVHLSVQQLTDCSSDSNYGNNGCQGGNVWNAYRYIYENGLIEDSAYQFSSGKTGIQGKCRFVNGKLDGIKYTGAVYKIKSFVWVNQGDDHALMEVLDQYGPVAIALDASDPTFVSYHRGEFRGCKNRTINIDHSTLLVGYEIKDKGGIKWKLRNQWGSDWSNNTSENSGSEMNMISDYSVTKKRGLRLNRCGISSLAFVPVLI